MRLKAIGILAVLLGGFAVYDQYDKTQNFSPVPARITALSDECFLEKVERGVITKTTSTSRVMPCELAEFLTKEHPSWEGFTIKHKIEVFFSYLSPVDGAQHSASLRLSQLPSDQAWREGETVQIRASKTKADKVRML